MTVYQRKKSRSLKWLVAIIIFAIAMSITWSDVYGADASSAMAIHQANESKGECAHSRFYPNWYPGFLKPLSTTLASAHLSLAIAEKNVAEATSLLEPASLKVLEVHRSGLINIS